MLGHSLTCPLGQERPALPLAVLGSSIGLRLQHLRVLHLSLRCERARVGSLLVQLVGQQQGVLGGHGGGCSRQRSLCVFARCVFQVFRYSFHSPQVCVCVTVYVCVEYWEPMKEAGEGSGPCVRECVYEGVCGCA